MEWTDEQVELRCNITMYAAKVSITKELADDLKECAGKLFAENSDDVAFYLRGTLVPELERKARKFRVLQAEQEERLEAVE